MHMVDNSSLNELSYIVRGCIYEVYNTLGPGLLESIYESALMLELQEHGLRSARQVPLAVEYKGHELGEGLRLDIVVEDSIIIELKSVEALQPVHHKQLLTYMKLAQIPLGFLVNFNTSDINGSIKRKVL